jgi:hypothetical protein
MTPRRIGQVVACTGAMLVPMACGWVHLDAIGPAVEPDGAPLADAAADLSTGVMDGAADYVSPPDSGVPPDSETADTPSAPEDASPDGGPPPFACSGSPNVVRQWTFDSDPQSWTLNMDRGVQGRLGWSGSIGDPSPGALQVDFTPTTIVDARSVDAGAASGAWVQYATTPLGDLSGRTISAWVLLDRGPSPQLKVFVQTGTQYAWADNGTITLIPHTWTCVSMPVSAPAYNGPNYDATYVTVLGLEMRGSAPFRVYVDTVRYF